MDLNLDARMETYYQKFIELQEKLRKSEEERLKLEMKFNEIVQISREEEQAHYRKLRSQYKKFLEEDRKRQERNESMFRTLERIETRIDTLTSKTERLKLLRRQYKSYLQRVTHREPNHIELAKPAGKVDSFSPERVDTEVYTHPAVKNAIGKRNDDKIELLDKYLQNLNAHKTYSNENPPDYDNDLKKLEGFSNRLHNGFDSDKANLIAEDIMNSIYARHYKKDDNLEPQYTPKSKYTSYNLPPRDTASTEYAGGDFFTTSNPKNKTHLIERGTDKVLSSKNNDPYYDSFPQSTAKPSVYNTDNENDSKMHKSYDIDKKNCGLEKGRKLSIDEKSLKNNLNDKNQEYLKHEVPNMHAGDDGKVLKDNENPRDSLKTSTYQQAKSNEYLETRMPEINSDFPPKINNWKHAVTRVLKNKKQFHNIPEQNSQQTLLLENYRRTNPMAYGNILTNESDYTKRYQDPVDNDQPSRQHEETYSSEQNVQNDEKYPEFAATVPQLQDFNQYNQNGEGIPEYNKNYQPNDNEQLPVEYDNQAYGQINESGKGTEQYNPDGQGGFDTQPIMYQESAQPYEQYEANGQPFQQYDETGELSQQYETSNQVADPYAYDANGQHVVQYDKDGRLDQYDETGQVIPQYYENGQPLLQYDDTGQVVPQYDANEQLTAQYDENGQVVAQYDSNGQPVVQYDENGELVPQYDANGQPVVQYDENGEAFPQYDANGQPVVQYDENGEAFPQYDANGQPVIQYTDINQVPLQYDESGDPAYQYDNQVAEIPQYDQFGQQVLYDESVVPVQHSDVNGIPMSQYTEDGNDGADPMFNQYNDEQLSNNYEQLDEVEQSKHASDQLEENHSTSEHLQGEERFGERVQYSEGSPEKMSDESDIRNSGAAKTTNVLELLDTDTENSVKQNVSKVTNDSDFDFSNG